MKTPLETRGSRATTGKSARLGKKQPDGTHAHRIAHVPHIRPLPRHVRVAPPRLGSNGRGRGGDGLARGSGRASMPGPAASADGARALSRAEMYGRADISVSRHSP